MKKTINIDFCEGDIVVLKTDPDTTRVVSGYLVRQKNVTYGLARGDEESWHQASEILKTKVFVVKGFRTNEGL